MLDAIIISDLHLGSDNCQARLLTEFLERIHDGDIPTARLILNGDVFDSMDFRRLSKHHWKVLSLLRKLSDHIDITWLVGNHDGSAEVISHLLGVNVGDEYVLETGDCKVLVLHGHIFDEFIDNHPILTWVADCIYHLLQWVDHTHYFAKLAKKNSKIFLRSTKKIHDKSVAYARQRHCQAVCCGHTHLVVADTGTDVAYYNSGCWTELPCHYLSVRDGVIQPHAFAPVEPVLKPSAEPISV